MGGDKQQLFIQVEAGMRLGKLYGEIIQSKVTNFSDLWVVGGGTCPTVGVVGHILCGGWGYFGRSLGLSSDQVVEIELVTDSAEIITVNQGKNPQLFWALRGSCSSSFGIIVSVTFALTKLANNRITTVTLPSIPFDKSISLTQWWQSWATVEAPSPLTLTLSFYSDGVQIRGVWLGPRVQALDVLYDTFVRAFNGLLEPEQVSRSFVEGSYEDAVLWWSATSGSSNTTTTLDDLLKTTSLPPLNDRFRRKGKSALVYSLLTEAEIERLIYLFTSKQINDLEMKAYGGVKYPVAEQKSGQNNYYTDLNSPLLRGHLYEIHYGNSYNAPPHEEDLEPKDQELVDKVEAAGSVITAIVGNKRAYPGYIDLNLTNPLLSYFGAQNGVKLKRMRDKFDPFRVFWNRASDFLFSPSKKEQFIPRRVYVGSFDSVIAVYSLSYDGSLEFEKSVTGLQNPVWLAFGPHERAIYLVNEIDNFNGLFSGAVSAYSIGDEMLDIKSEPEIRNAMFDMQLINTVASRGASPNHVHVENYNLFQCLYVANACGTLTVHPINEDNDAVLDSIQSVTFGTADKCGDSLPFLHHVVLNRDWAYIVDKNTDRVYVFVVDRSTGLLKEDTKTNITLEPGSGPRHMAFHPVKDVAFLISENANTITVLQRDPLLGSLQPTQVVSTLRSGESPRDMFAGEIATSDDGRTLYASNRDNSSPNQNRSSIAVFSFDPYNNSLSILQHVYSQGAHPRHFEIVHLYDENKVNQKIMLVTNKNSNNIAAFLVNDDGTIKFSGKTTSTLPHLSGPVQVLVTS